MTPEQSESICGLTWPEDASLMCLRPSGHRGSHIYEDPPFGYAYGGVVSAEAAQLISDYIDANGCMG
jgi:hypothetical protein